MSQSTKSDTAQSKKGFSINPIILTIGSAVGAVLLITLLRPFFGPKDASDPSVLFHKYSTPSPITLVGKMNGTNALLEVEKKFNQANYKKAATLFDPLIEANPSSYKLYLFDGISHLQEGESNAALLRFDAILDKEDGTLKEEALWYKALTYLQQDDKKNGQVLLQEIAQNKAYIYHEKATKLLLDWQ